MGETCFPSPLSVFLAVLSPGASCRLRLSTLVQEVIARRGLGQHILRQRSDSSSASRLAPAVRWFAADRVGAALPIETARGHLTNGDGVANACAGHLLGGAITHAVRPPHEQFDTLTAISVTVVSELGQQAEWAHELRIERAGRGGG